MAQGWVTSCQRGGPGGRSFNDLAELQQMTGRPADEFQLCELQFYRWVAIGGLVTTYRNVITGAIVRLPRRGRLGDAHSPLALPPHAWVTAALVRVGDSRYQAGGVCVDKLKLMVQDGSLCGPNDHNVAGSSAHGPCQSSLFQGSLNLQKESPGPSPEPRRPRPTERGTLRIADLEPGKLGVVAGGQVVRAVQGRAGDSLDAISFVLGPPIPEVWSPGTHALFPARTRLALRTVLLASRRPDGLLHKLNRDVLEKIFVLVAAW